MTGVYSLADTFYLMMYGLSLFRSIMRHVTRIYYPTALLRVITVNNAKAAVTLLEQRTEKIFQALSGIRTHDLCGAGAVLS